MPKKVGIVVNGVGTIGYCTLRSIIDLIEYLRTNRINTCEINLDLVGIIEPNKERVDLLKNYFTQEFCINPNIIFCSEEIQSLLNKIITDKDFYIIYDSTPTRKHEETFSSLIYHKLFTNQFKDTPPIYYFGETPLSLDKEFIDAIENRKLCNYAINFIELENPTYKTLKKYLFENNCEILSMNFFRCSSIGVEKIFRPDRRKGITGGALGDISPHDLALTIDLLGGINEISFIYSPQVTPCFKNFKFPCYMPANYESLVSSQPTFMSQDATIISNLLKKEKLISNRQDDKEYWEYAADAEFELNIDWKMKSGRIIPSKYYSSWLGVPEKLKEKMKTVGIKDENLWLNTGVNRIELNINNTTLKNFRTDEARIIFLKIKKESIYETIVCNFLKRDAPSKINLWIKIIRGSTIEDIPVNVDSFIFGNNSIQRMLIHLLKCISQDTLPDSNIGGNISNIAHYIICEARDKVFKKIIDLSQDYPNIDKRYAELYKNRFLDFVSF